MTTETQAPDPALALVPREATPDMTRAAVVYANGSAVYKNVAAEALAIEESIYGEVWDAMLAAAPAIPAPEGVGLTDEQIHELIEQHAGYGGDDIRAVVRAAIAADRAQRAAPAPKAAPEWPCTCDDRGIGVPGVSCGDCPRDYGHKVKAPQAAPASHAEFALRALVAAGHITQGKADEAMQIAERAMSQTKEPTDDR